MIKALMVITMVSGTTYEVKLPSMQSCQAERTPVEVQADVASTACIPFTEDSNSFDKIKVMMNLFREMVDDLEARQKKCGSWDQSERDEYHWLLPAQKCG